MRIHPRDRLLMKEKSELSRAVNEWLTKDREYELTSAEERYILMDVLAGLIEGAAKYEIRAERECR